VPKRPREHQVETESRVAFQGALPSRLVYRDVPHPEYGLDAEVEEFDERERPTGVRFYVQLKGTDTTELTRALRKRIPLGTAAYYRAQPVPVLMVRFIAPKKTLYARWFHEFDPHYEHVGDTHITFRWSGDDESTADSIEELLDEARKFMQIRAARLDMPLRVGLEVQSGGVHGLTRPEVELALRTAMARCPEVLQLAVEGESPLLKLVAGDESLSANLGGLYTMTLHVNESYEPGDMGEALATDVLSCAAVVLARSGHANVSTQVAVPFFAESFLACVDEAAWDLASAFAYSKRATDAIDLAERLDQNESEDVRQTAMIVLLGVLTRSHALNATEREALGKALENRLERRRAESDSLAAAAAAVALGNHHMASQEHGKAVERFDEALQLDGGYATRVHYWDELAGAYFLSGRYGDSADAYAKALELIAEPDEQMQACRADALLYAGRYREAYGLFSEIDSEVPAIGAWVSVKRRALDWVLEVTGVERQDRDPERAADIAGELTSPDLSDPERDEVRYRVWQLDAASPLGWFNSARDYLNRGKEDHAMHAYLTAAVMHEGDVEAWVNVGILAMNLEDEELFLASIITGARLNREAYLSEFARQARNAQGEGAREGILNIVNEIIEAYDALPQHEGGHEVRFVFKEEPVHSVHVPRLDRPYRSG